MHSAAGITFAALPILFLLRAKLDALPERVRVRDSIVCLWGFLVEFASRVIGNPVAFTGVMG